MTNTSDCSQVCDRCSDNEPCGVENGYCYGGCIDGLWGISCDQSYDCANDEPCRMSDGYCEGGCRNGSWGTPCKQRCDCEGQPCDQHNGTCPFGELIKLNILFHTTMDSFSIVCTEGLITLRNSSCKR